MKSLYLSKIKSHQIIQIFKERVFLGKFFKNFSFGHYLYFEIFNVTLIHNLNGKIMNFCFEMIKEFPAHLVKFHLCRIRRK